MNEFSHWHYSEEPYAHAWCDDFIDSGDLLKLYAKLPDREEFDWIHRDYGVYGLWDCADKGTNAFNRYWHHLECKYFNEKLKTGLLSLFENAINTRDMEMFGSLRDNQYLLWKESGSIDWRLARNSLPDHLDWPNRMLSVVLYLDPYNEAQKEWGTRLYHYPKVEATPLAEFSRKSQKAIEKLDREQFKLLEFKGNRLVVFMNSHRSFHGAKVSADSSSKGRLCIVKGINLSLEYTEKMFGLSKELKG